MPGKKTLSILITTYNEEAYIERLLQRLLNATTLDWQKEIIIVDDGSKDKTPHILRKKINRLKKEGHFFTLVCRKHNLGKGASLREALSHATGDLVLTQDADLEYHPKDIAVLLKKIMNPKVKVVYGSRVLGKTKIKHGGFVFFWGGKFLNWLANLLYNIEITDEATGYKLFDAQLIKSLNLQSQRFEFCPEVTAKIAKKGIKIHEVPISYEGRTLKEGKKIRWHDGIEAIYTLIKYRFID